MLIDEVDFCNKQHGIVYEKDKTKACEDCTKLLLRLKVAEGWDVRLLNDNTVSNENHVDLAKDDDFAHVMEKTDRGFDLKNFSDWNDEKCSLQKSSIATEDCIWLGVTEPTVKALAKELHPERADELNGWLNVPLPECACVSGRMHLTQDMVKELLPHLIKFAETGDLS